MWREFSCDWGMGVFDVYPFQNQKKKSHYSYAAYSAQWLGKPM